MPEKATLRIRILSHTNPVFAMFISNDSIRGYVFDIGKGGDLSPRTEMEKQIHLRRY